MTMMMAAVVMMMMVGKMSFMFKWPCIVTSLV